MLKTPVSNDPENPLVSILICEYSEKYLRQCLDSIFNQSILDNLEILFVDSSLNDGAWNIAIEYARQYKDSMTIMRVGPLSKKMPTRACKELATGKYIAILRRDGVFLPEYVKQCVAIIETNPLANFSNVMLRQKYDTEWPNVDGKPLVSVLIHNYNYGRYLRQCLDSVFAQTYDNIAIIFSDNASTDDSWNIATEYARRYPGNMTINRYRINLGPSANAQTCVDRMEGKYFCVLCSDDAFHPNFVQDCVRALEANPDCAFAMTHRAIIDEQDNSSFEPPFYNQSCVIPGQEQAAVYMMSSINPSISQIMYDRTKTRRLLTPSGNNLVRRWFDNRIFDFNLCCKYPVAYIKEPLLLHRVHSASDSSQISGNLLEIFGQYILPHLFVEMAAGKENMGKVTDRLPDALAKLSRLCLRYSTRALIIGNDVLALRYFHLSAAIMPHIMEDPVYVQLCAYWAADSEEKIRTVTHLKAAENLTTRMVSYDPPLGSVPID